MGLKIPPLKSLVVIREVATRYFFYPALTFMIYSYKTREPFFYLPLEAMKDACMPLSFHFEVSAKWFLKTLFQQVYVSFNVAAPKIVSENDQEIPQSQTADNPMAPRGRSTQPSGDTRKTN